MTVFDGLGDKIDTSEFPENPEIDVAYYIKGYDRSAVYDGNRWCWLTVDNIVEWLGG